jgi:sensor histidine kinase YesM
MINDAEKIYRNLGEEIDFVRTYFELEKLRFGEKFNYEIDTGEGITLGERVPKLVLHTFAENAIKHGIIPKNEGGFISIKINKEQDYFRIIVEDNGIGRGKAMQQRQISTGKGLKLTREFYDILNSLNDNPVSYNIIDLYDTEGNPAGTRVEILVPGEFGVPMD